MARIETVQTPLAGVLTVRRRRIEDERGFLSRLYSAEEFAAVGANKPIAQINHTKTRLRGTVRGMHFQYPPHAEVKLVTCLRGEVFDVALDLRRASPTYLHWHAELLTETNDHSLLIPEGVAHGFQTLTDDCELLYLHSAAYQPDAEGAVNAGDPRVAIAWPLAIASMSERDRRHPLLTADFEGLRL